MPYRHTKTKKGLGLIQVNREFNDFKEDLHEHVHLENNILFPKVIGFEEELM